MKKYQIVKSVTAASMAACLVMAGLSAYPGCKDYLKHGGTEGERITPSLFSSVVVHAAENDEIGVCNVIPVNTPDDITSYLKGSVKKNAKAWKKAKTVKKKNGKYAFSVKKNGTYTVRLTTNSGKKYVAKIKVKGIR